MAGKKGATKSATKGLNINLNVEDVKPQAQKPKPFNPAPTLVPTYNVSAKGNEKYVHFSDKLTGALNNISNVIDDNKGTIDSIQDMAIQLTRTVQILQVVVMKYVDKADKILDVAGPLVDKFPVFPDGLRDFIKDAQNISNKIIQTSDLAAKVLPGVEKSLMAGDLEGLQATKSGMAQLTKSLQTIAIDK
ncbi:MAG TPA: hypothetical protein PKD55_06960 [Bellilinea sp.]|nr:hypothetical protein [Bellilinea sp.]